MSEKSRACGQASTDLGIQRKDSKRRVERSDSRRSIERQGSKRSLGSSNGTVRFAEESPEVSAEDEAEKQAMEERVRRLVGNIYGKDVQKHRKLRPGEIRRSDELEKLLPPARTPEEEEAHKIVRKRAEEYMAKGWGLWTDELRALRDYYLKLISGEKTFEDDEMFFDSRAVIAGNAGVEVKQELSRGGLQ